MPHHPSSSAAPAVSGGSSSSAAPASFYAAFPDLRPRFSKNKKDKKKNTNKRPCKVMEFPPYRVPSKEEYEAVENMIVDLDVKHFEENVDFGKSYFKPGPFIDVFDAKRLRRHPPKNESVVPLHLKDDPSLFQILAKCAMLAIGDYNSQTKSDYRFVDIEMATWQLVAGTLYHITFQARNAEKKYETFEATVLIDMCMKEVQRIRIKGSNTWYNGTHRELVN